MQPEELKRFFEAIESPEYLSLVAMQGIDILFLYLSNYLKSLHSENHYWHRLYYLLAIFCTSITHYFIQLQTKNPEQKRFLVLCIATKILLKCPVWEPNYSDSFGNR